MKSNKQVCADQASAAIKDPLHNANKNDYIRIWLLLCFLCKCTNESKRAIKTTKVKWTNKQQCGPLKRRQIAWNGEIALCVTFYLLRFSRSRDFYWWVCDVWVHALRINWHLVAYTPTNGRRLRIRLCVYFFYCGSIIRCFYIGLNYITK